MHRLLSLDDLNRQDIEQLFAQAEHYLHSIKQDQQLETLQGKVVANLFFENSTRTRCSFELAAKRLGAIVLSPDMHASSLAKGESTLDMILNLHAMGTRAFVLRMQDFIEMQQIADALPQNVLLLNAGAGHSAHPTQALLDIFTIAQQKTLNASLKVVIMGDLRHSRVARSLIKALHKVDVTDIHLVAPDELIAAHADFERCTHETDTSKAVLNADVIVCLRMQYERHASELTLSKDDYIAQYQLQSQHLELAKPDAIVMHPGPVNRDLEISSDVLLHERSVILQQVTHGVAIRMGLLKKML